MGPCIVIYFYSKTNQMHSFSSLLNITLHVPDGLSVHHQEFKTVHTASGMCHTRFFDCTLAGTRWWTERPSETCRVMFDKPEKLCI